MACRSTGAVYCDLHDNVAAIVICMKHYEWMCVECLVQKKHSARKCEIKKIDNLSELEQKKTDIALFKKEVKRKRQNLKGQESELERTSKELQGQVNTFYEKLTHHLQSIRQTVMDSIDQQKHVIRENLKRDMDKLSPLERETSKILEKLKDSNLQQNEENIRHTLAAANSISTRIRVYGAFTPCEALREAILKMKDLGSVIVGEEEDEYNFITEDQGNNKNPNCTDEVKQNATIAVDANAHSNVTDPGVYSEEYDPTTDVTRGHSDTNVHNLESTYLEPKVTASKSKDTVAEENLTNKEKQASETSCVDVDAEYVDMSNVKPELPLDEVKSLHPLEGFTTTAKLSKLASLQNEELIVFLNLAQDEVVLCDVNGLNVTDRQPCTSPIDLTAFDDRFVAVLHSLKPQIEIYMLENEKLCKQSNVHLSMDLAVSEITGFDKCPTLSEYAISCTTKIIFFDELGNVKRNVDLDFQQLDNDIIVSSPVIMSTYDFDKKCVYIVKSSANRNTYKCYNLAEEKMVWRKLCADDVPDPVAVSLLDDKLMTLCKTVVLKISTDVGERIEPPMNITCLPGKALGFCALKHRNRILVTTNGQTLEQSLTIGFIGVSNNKTDTVYF